MADKPLQVRKEQPKFPSMNYDFLRAEGLRIAQELSGDLWTDYNAHDPGITILEQFCYALTDLAYRTDFKIQELLNAKPKRGKAKPFNNAFFDASSILPSNPVTINDYRILIIDRIREVKNCWVEPVRNNLKGIQGLYRVLLEIDENARTPERIALLKKEVFTLFAGHRNLCEDIESIQVLNVDKIVVHADIDISSDAVGEEVLANMLFRLENYLTPTVKFHTLEDMLEAGYSVDEVFDGPPPVHGFVKKEELLPLKKEVYVSKLIEAISHVEGVRRITYFKVEKNGISVEGDVISLNPDTYPVLDMDTLDKHYIEGNDYPIQFFRGALPYEADLNTTNQLLYSMFASYKKGYQMKKLYNKNEYPSSLNSESIPAYYTMQNTFPMTYGLNKLGLPDNVKPTRKRLALVKQLRGYLLFFEQIMANYLAQLANIKELFSIDYGVNKTYFSQEPSSIPFIDELKNTKTPSDFIIKLEEIVADFDPFTQRRNKFLDHILARFSEQFSTDFLVKMNQSRYVEAGEISSEQQIINAKIKFLQNYEQISKNKSRGFNYLNDQTSVENVSGLERRVALLLDMNELGNQSMLSALQGVETENEEVLAAMETLVRRVNPVDVEGEGVLDLDELSDSVQRGEEREDYRKQFVFRFQSLNDLLSNLCDQGGIESNYLMLPVEGEENMFFIFYKGDRSQEPYKIYEIEGVLEAREAIRQLVRYFNKLSRYTEGMHVVEHTLLRPQAKDRHGFHLLSDSEEPLLVCLELGDKDDLEVQSNEIPQVGGIAANYELVEEQGEWKLLLNDVYGKPIARHTQLFKSRSDAEEAREDLIDYINSFKENNLPIYDNIRFFLEERDSSSGEGSFYSLRLSVILPQWPSRFQNDDLQVLLSNLVCLNIPVHLGVEFYWLEAGEMRDFEAVYFEWLEERLKAQPEQPDLDDKAYEVVKHLQRYENGQQVKALG